MRIRQLDILRGIAILLVLGAHTALPVLSQSGWVGVDLFFVLSGYLVSGLLFGEYKARGEISAGRFLTRRGLKIYPSFYLLLAFTFAVINRHIAIEKIIGEVFFLQNYLGSVWGFTWSLAIEEHFYIGLAVGVFALTKTRLIHSVPKICIAICITCLVFRCFNLAIPYAHLTHVAPTHLRIDSLSFGVLISYYSHFRRERLEGWVKGNIQNLYAVALLLIAPAFALPLSHPFIFTIGFTLLYLGFGLLLLWALNVQLNAPKALVAAGSLIARIGIYSYSIYLWQGVVAFWMPPVLFVPAAIALGVVMAKVVELPMITLRDRMPRQRQRIVTANYSATDNQENPIA